MTTTSSSSPTTVPNSSSNGTPDLETLSHARDIVRNHIALLHRYNEIKDVGMGLLSLLADRDGRRLGEVMELFGVDERD